MRHSAIAFLFKVCDILMSPMIYNGTGTQQPGIFLWSRQLINDIIKVHIQVQPQAKRVFLVQSYAILVLYFYDVIFIVGKCLENVIGLYFFII